MTRKARQAPSSLLDLELPRGLAAPGEARRAVGLLLRRIDPGLMTTTELLLTELVSNSVRHGGAQPEDAVRIEVLVSDDMVRVEVSDHGPGFTPPAEPRAVEDVSGAWGLVIVERASARWGTLDGGRRVWFELERNGHARPTPS